MSIQADFEKRFEADEYEMLVLMKAGCRGALQIEDMLRPSVNILASVDLRTGVLSQKSGRIEWLIKNDRDRAGWGYEFEQFEIYHIVVREVIDKQLEPCYMLVKVLQEKVSNTALDELKLHYAKPVMIQNELGEFKLDREFSVYEGCIDWNGAEAKIFLETDDEDVDSAEKSMEVLLKLAEDFEGNDRRYRKYAAKELTPLANEWLEESDEEAPEEITEEVFAERIEISEVSISPDGSMSLFYYDDDMFWGHVIEILVEADGEITTVGIAG